MLCIDVLRNSRAPFEWSGVRAFTNKKCGGFGIVSGHRLLVVRRHVTFLPLCRKACALAKRLREAFSLSLRPAVFAPAWRQRGRTSLLITFGTTEVDAVTRARNPQHLPATLKPSCLGKLCSGRDSISSARVVPQDLWSSKSRGSSRGRSNFGDAQGKRAWIPES